MAGPSEPENLRVVTTTATTATVAWETPSHTNGNIERYQLQFRKQGEAGTLFCNLLIIIMLLVGSYIALSQMSPGHIHFMLNLKTTNIKTDNIHKSVHNYTIG